MTDTVDTVVLLAAILAAGLQAGTYYAWASGVMPGLASVDDRTFVHALQQMNLAIVNPVFLASFLGAPVLAVLAILTTEPDPRPWVIAGAVGAVASVLVTAAGNIPLNNALDAAGPVEEIADVTAVRSAFESRWVRLNIIRAVTSTLSLGLLAVAALQA